MNEVEVLFFGLAAFLALAVLWVHEFWRERQLRTMQSRRLMKSLREALLREDGADREGNAGGLRKPSVILGSGARGSQPAHARELSLVLYSDRRL